jgi:predicted secreted protein
MPALSGRAMRIKRGSTALGGARTDNLNINNEMVDITDKSDVAWRTLLPDVGVRSVDADVEFVLKDGTLLALAVGAGSALLEGYTVEITGIGDFTGNFFLSNVTLGSPMADTITGTATINSSGQITFTAD